MFPDLWVEKRTVFILYTNYRGQQAWRKVLPLSMWFGVSPYHERPQWFVKAVALDRADERDFALKDIAQWRTEEPVRHEG